MPKIRANGDSSSCKLFIYGNSSWILIIRFSWNSNAPRALESHSGIERTWALPWLHDARPIPLYAMCVSSKTVNFAPARFSRTAFYSYIISVNRFCVGSIPRYAIIFCCRCYYSLSCRSSSSARKIIRTYEYTARAATISYALIYTYLHSPYD